MSEILATSPALPGEADTVEGRLADIMAGADCEVRVSDYRLSDSDKAKVVAALRNVAPCTREPSAEAVARTICLSYGHDPDALTDWLEMCDANNQPVPTWRVYEEQAEAVLKAHTLTGKDGSAAS